MTAITRDELVSALDDGAVTLVEVLPATYYDDAHLPGAINIPPDRLDVLAPQLLTDRDALIVAYCSNASCENSTTASRRLTELGYRNVRDYEAGKEDWIAAGLPTESSLPASMGGHER